MKFVNILALAGSFGVANAWRLHESCQKPEYRELVLNNMNSAFSMAGEALTAIDEIRNGRENGDNRNALQWMFLKDGERIESQSLKMNKVRDTYSNIGRMSRQHDGCDGDKKDDFVVYCDFERFEKLNDNFHRDEDTGVQVKSKQYEESKELCDKKSHFTLAFTEDQSNAMDNVPSQLQICPWFLDWMKNQDEGKPSEPFHRANILQNLVIPLLKTKVGRNLLSDIDSTSLFDKVLLHEMTHTFGAGKCKDVDCDEDSLWANWLEIKYGWKRCRELAQEGPTDLRRAPYNNADTLALAASAIRFNNQGKVVQEDGSISDCN